MRASITNPYCKPSQIGFSHFSQKERARRQLDSNWHYIELHCKKDATTGFAGLFVDTVKVVATTYVNTTTFGNAAQLFVGLAMNSGSPGFGSKADVVIDDVVMASA